MIDEPYIMVRSVSLLDGLVIFKVLWERQFNALFFRTIRRNDTVFIVNLGKSIK